MLRMVGIAPVWACLRSHAVAVMRHQLGHKCCFMDPCNLLQRRQQVCASTLHVLHEGAMRLLPCMQFLCNV